MHWKYLLAFCVCSKCRLFCSQKIHRVESVQWNLLLCSRCNLLVWHTSNGGNAFFISLLLMLFLFGFRLSSHRATAFFFCCCFNHFDWKFGDFSIYKNMNLFVHTTIIHLTVVADRIVHYYWWQLIFVWKFNLGPYTFFIALFCLFVCVCQSFFVVAIVTVAVGVSCVYECSMNELGKIIVAFAKQRKWQCNICILPSNLLVWIFAAFFFLIGGHNFVSLLYTECVFAIRKAFSNVLNKF